MALSGRRRSILWTALALAPGAAGWGLDGHERIARIADVTLKGKHQDQIRTMMHGDAIDVASWTIMQTKLYPATESMLWHRQTPEWTCSIIKATGEQHLGDHAGHIKCDDKSAESDSLFCALAFFFDQFSHKALLKEFPAPKEPINVPRRMPALDKVPAPERSKANYLRWLSVLIGDLHQPLHWLKEHDYGRDVVIRYKDANMSLLSFWEDYIPGHLPKIPSPREIDQQYEQRSQKWLDKMPTELFREWAKETAETLCHQVYGPLEVNHADGSRTIQSPFELPEELFQQWVKLAQDFTTLGGERLGFILNDILEHKRHKAALGSGRGIHHRVRRRQQWFQQNLAINGAIALVVVPLWLTALRMHEKMGNINIMSLLKSHAKV